MVDVTAVGLGERGTVEEENVLGVELGAPRKIIGAGDDGVVDDQNLVVHEIVAAGRAVGSRVFSCEMGALNDVVERRDLPMVRRNSLPLGVNLRHLGAIVDA